MLQLDTVTAGRYARRRGFDVDPDSARILTGGVSGTVIALDGRPALVAKQARAALTVEAEWRAPLDRISTEARALRVTRLLTPQHVPEVYDLDTVNHTMLIERAPNGWMAWRDRLLTDPSSDDIVVAGKLGELLGTWHAATWNDAEIRASFADDLAFAQLRVDPFHRDVARQHPDLAPLISPLIDQLASVRECLVHGDFSPKNVLLGDDGYWVIDHEVARYGFALFDVAFLLSHLLLKAVHRPEAAPLLYDAADSFLRGYHDIRGARVAPQELGAHTAVLLLARIDGKSPARYLRTDERHRVRSLAREALASLSSIDELWRAVLSPAEEKS